MTSKHLAEPPGCERYPSETGRYLSLLASVPTDRTLESFVTSKVIPLVNEFAKNRRELSFSYIPQADLRPEAPRPFYVHIEIRPDASVDIQRIREWRDELGQQLRQWFEEKNVGTYGYGLRETNENYLRFQGGIVGSEILARIDTATSRATLKFATQIDKIESNSVRVAKAIDVNLSLLQTVCAFLSHEEQVSLLRDYERIIQEINAQNGLPSVKEAIDTGLSGYADKIKSQISLGGNSEEAWAGIINELKDSLKYLNDEIKAKKPLIAGGDGFHRWFGMRVMHGVFLRFYVDNVTEAIMVSCMRHIWETK
jgi:hypothetical protein